MKKPMNLGGRPRIFEDLQDFKKLCLDPLSTSKSTLNHAGISRATYYRYLKTARVPTLRVAVSGPSAVLSRIRSTDIAEPADRFDFEVARLLSSLMGVRFKVGLIDGVRSLDLLHRNEVDISIGRMTDSKERRKRLYFSHPYLEIQPHGVIIGEKRLAFDLEEGRAKKRTLGVVRGTLHSEFAAENLCHRINVRNFKSEAEAARALQAGRIDFRLTSSIGTFKFLHSTPNFEIKPERFDYSGRTCIAFSPWAEQWRPVFNRALEQAQDLGLLQALEERYLRASPPNKSISIELEQ